MLSDADEALLADARRIIALRRKEHWHSIGAALRTKSGRQFAAVHLDATVGRISVCAEAVALGMAAAEGDTDVETVVAVNRDGVVVAPCGMCRELVSDYAPDARVIVPGDPDPAVVRVLDLLPNKYRRVE